jgi:hypothetical protein
MSLHNYFFYFKKNMPWKTPTNCEFAYEAQDKRTKRSGKKRQEVDRSKEAPDESGSDSPPAGAYEEGEA